MIFINYRREDSSWCAHALYQFLEKHFASRHLFMDVENRIAGGEDFIQALCREIKRASVMLALIGPQWLTNHAGRSRLHDARDHVREEIDLGAKAKKARDTGLD